MHNDLSTNKARVVSGGSSVKILNRISPDLLRPLEKYRQWILQESTQKSIRDRMRTSPVDFRNPEASCSKESLMAINHGGHEGFPLSFYGVDLNYKNVQKESAQFGPEFFNEVRDINLELDDEIQNFLGARVCALKAYYPAHGHIGWHTNWNVPGYVIILTYSPDGQGYWRHVDPAGAKSITPDPEKVIHIPDQKGWHGKAGYFGKKTETDKLVWHCAYTSSPRITVSYVIDSESVWRDMVDEMSV